ncbi:MAG: hypothetical protein HS111_08530 [Kofleriaceae bacterium]|nr:hypothetical protein [Kofleriaceae bacterium]
MIAAPHNDRTCLDAITEHLAARVRARDPEIARVAEAHADTRALADWIRSLPQRDDDGLPDDGPKVDACEPAQRLRVPARDPNCVERAALYLAAAELIDDGPVRQLATARTPGGLHTFPIEDGEPVVLDPDVSRNALAGGLFRSQSLRNSETLALAPEDLIDWLADLAAEPAAGFAHGAARVERGHRALRGVPAGRPLCVADVRDVAFLLALARREARLWGPVGPWLVATAVHAVDRLVQVAAARWQAGLGEATRRNAPELALGDLRLRPDGKLLAALGRVGGRIGAGAAIEALRVKLAALGLAPQLLTGLERELQREGLSLGPLAKPPPMIGSLGAITPEAIAGRWLATKL